MNNLIWLLIVVGVVAVVMRLTEQCGGTGKDKGEEKKVELHYKLKTYFFSRTEQAFYLDSEASRSN